MNESLLICHMLFGLVGFAFFTYGKKQRALIPFVVGIALFLLPYFISSMSTLIILGIVLSLTPFFINSPDIL